MKRYPDLEAIIAGGRFADPKGDLRLYKRLATMVTDAPLGKIPDHKPDWTRAAALTAEWELKALTERLEQLAAAS